jgi:hypothetical protein
MSFREVAVRSLFFLILLMASSAAAGEGPSGGITGTVTDAATLAPIVGATVMIEGTATGTMTDASGNGWRIDVHFTVAP